MTDGPKLLEQAARAVHWAEDQWNPRTDKNYPFEEAIELDIARAVIRAILPHLSEESRARLEKELSGE